MGNRQELVVKSNRLVEAGYRLTLAEQRLILFAITEARKTQTGLSTDSVLAVRAAAYAETFGIQEKQAYEQIKAASATLFGRYVVLYGKDPATGQDDKIQVRWLSSVRYVDGAGTVYLQFAQQMVPHITRLEAEFTRYKLEKVADMSSPYAIRLYELLMQWGSVGQREVGVDWLKGVLMAGDEYPRLDNFKRRVVDVAVAQINGHSDLKVSYAQRKTGRAVTHFAFSFQAKAAPKRAFDKGLATLEQQAVEFLRGNPAYHKRYGNIAPQVLWRTPAVWEEFREAFEEWRRAPG